MPREPGPTRYHSRTVFGLTHRIAGTRACTPVTLLGGRARKYWLTVLLLCGSAAGLASCVKTAEVEMEVSYANKGGLVLSIRNESPHHVIFEEPKPGARSECFEWDLCRGRKILATSRGRVLEKPTVDPLIPAHTIPPVKEVWPGAPFKIELNKYYTELADRDLLFKADTFRWYCRVWDETKKSWIRTSGTLVLNPEER